MGRGHVWVPVFWMYLPAQHGEGMGYTHISEMTADSRNNLQQAWLNSALANWRWNHLSKTVGFFFKSLHFLLMTWSWKCLFESLSNLVKESAQILLSRTVGYKMMIEQRKGQLQGLTVGLLIRERKWWALRKAVVLTLPKPVSCLSLLGRYQDKLLGCLIIVFHTSIKFLFLQAR